MTQELRKALIDLQGPLADAIVKASAELVRTIRYEPELNSNVVMTRDGDRALATLRILLEVRAATEVAP